MQKTVTYLYPDRNKASSLKVFQDTSNQILGLYFTRENIKDVENIENSKNYAVYFLFNNSQDDESRVYVGQSINGVERIKNHVVNKEFWSYCIMFVTDNNRFDTLTIDYLEYEFIKKFKKSSYTLANKDPRDREPNCSMFEKANINSYIEQIEFLLSTEGVSLQEETPTNGLTYYKAKGGYDAKLYVSNGKFVICNGSEMNRPADNTVNYSSNFYNKYNSQIDAYLSDGKIQQTGDKFITLVDLSFKSPSKAAELISGKSKNGWDFFTGLNELRGI